MSGSPRNRAPGDNHGLTERAYRIIVAKDGTYGVEIKPIDTEAPLTISGFDMEEAAHAWIAGQQRMRSGVQPSTADIADSSKDTT
jgi:hypothetical protein